MSPERDRIRQRQVRQLEDLKRFEAWAAVERARRTEASRAETARLNRLALSWFSGITVKIDEASVEMVATRRFPVDDPLTARRATVWFDRIEWTRVGRADGWPRLRYGNWSDAEILGALRAWSDENGRCPSWIDWVKAGTNRPNSVTVQRRFGSWNRALRRAGLRPYKPDTLPRNYAWNDAELIQALKDWSTEHGRAPKWHEWLRSAPGRPCHHTIVEHFGSWHAGLTAAGLH